MARQVDVALRLQCGIPVVEIGGEWSAALLEAIEMKLVSLQQAGHFEIVLNVQRAALGGIAGLRSLASEARAVRSHHGCLDIVGTVEQIEELARSGVAGPFRLAQSEEMALSRIKKTPVFASGPRLVTRTVD